MNETRATGPVPTLPGQINRKPYTSRAARALPLLNAAPDAFHRLDLTPAPGTPRN